VDTHLPHTLPAIPPPPPQLHAHLLPPITHLAWLLRACYLLQPLPTALRTPPTHLPTCRPHPLYLSPDRLDCPRPYTAFCLSPYLQALYLTRLLPRGWSHTHYHPATYIPTPAPATWNNENKWHRSAGLAARKRAQNWASRTTLPLHSTTPLRYATHCFTYPVIAHTCLYCTLTPLALRAHTYATPPHAIESWMVNSSLGLVVENSGPAGGGRTPLPVGDRSALPTVPRANRW